MVSKDLLPTHTRKKGFPALHLAGRVGGSDLWPRDFQEMARVVLPGWCSLESEKAPGALMALDLLIQEQETVPWCQPWWLRFVTTSANEELSHRVGGSSGGHGWVGTGTGCSWKGWPTSPAHAVYIRRENKQSHRPLEPDFEAQTGGSDH